MTKLAPEWVRTSDPVIRSPARYRWTTAPAFLIRLYQGVWFHCVLILISLDRERQGGFNTCTHLDQITTGEGGPKVDSKIIKLVMPSNVHVCHMHYDSVVAMK